MSRLITRVDPSGLFSKLSRPVKHIQQIHHSIRERDVSFQSGPRVNARRRIILAEVDILAAEAHYLNGATLREAALPLGISHMRFASLLRERGIKVRRSAPTEAQIDQMVYRYEAGESLAKIGERLGFQPNTVRTQLLRRGVTTRDTHGLPKGEHKPSVSQTPTDSEPQ